MAQISSGLITLPVQSFAGWTYGNHTLYPDYGSPTGTILSQSLAAVTTVNISAAVAGKRTRILRLFFSVDAGGPYFFTFGSAGSFRMRQTPPFIYTLDFAPMGVDCGINQNLTLRNDHATVAGNIEVYFLGRVEDEA